MFFPRLLLCVSAFIFVSGCATVEPAKLKGAKFESQDLSDALGNRRVVVHGKYAAKWEGETYTEADYAKDPRTDKCHDIREGQMLEKSVATWAPTLVGLKDMKPDDVQIVFIWSCGGYYTSASGGSAALSVFTLGIAPHLTNMRLSLNIALFEKQKRIFSKKYEQETSPLINLWADKNGKITQKHFAESAAVLIERFTKDLSRDGALEK